MTRSFTWITTIYPSRALSECRRCFEQQNFLVRSVFILQVFYFRIIVLVLPGKGLFGKSRHELWFTMYPDGVSTSHVSYYLISKHPQALGTISLLLHEKLRLQKVNLLPGVTQQQVEGPEPNPGNLFLEPIILSH